MKNQQHDPLITEEMPTVIRQELQQFREIPQPAPASWQAARAAFLAEARQLASESVTFVPVARHKGWVGKTFHTLIPSLKEANPMVLLLKIALIVSLMTGAGAGTVAAAQGSLPGYPLYSVKIAWEDAQARLATTPETRLERALTMAETRVAEMLQLAEGGQDIPYPAIERYAQHLGAAIQAMEELPEPAQTQARARIQEQLALHEQALEQIRERLQEHTGDEAPGAGPGETLETPLREMDGILKRSRDRLQDPNGNPPAIRPTELQRTPNPEAPAPGSGEPNPTEPNLGPGEPGPNPTAPTPGPGEPGGGPGPNPTEAAPGPGEPGFDPGTPSPEPPTVEPTPGEPGAGPGEPGAGPGPNPTEPGPVTPPGTQHP